ncbi:hypothetical protein [Roseicyclus persicicus]|uniref:Sulfotransferase family protein n=1 Tax=Roseicyclus persicicus TaxID=2650661 RepID=A0A7X6JYR0_9RHOB|nr:hypothetical protein [Roseibacterium persicicum]NKX44008.1 hypothetical protein [Roseibacterium persicicum]
MLDYDLLRRSAVLLGDYRTGTQYLKLLLSQVTGFRAPVEPFGHFDDRSLDGHGEAIDIGHTLETVVREGALDTRDLILDPNRAIAAYLALLQARVPQGDPRGEPSPFLLDIKYDHCFRFGAEAPGRTPTLLRWLVAHRLPFIHLIRRDAIGQAISAAVAEERGVWLETDRFRGDRPAGGIYLDPAVIVDAAIAHREARREMQAQLARLGARVLVIAYEDAIGPGRPGQLRRAMRFLDVWVRMPAEAAPVTRSQASHEMVANLPEILDAALRADPELVGRAY